MKKRLADYLVGRLFELTGSDHCFLLSGGGIMHLLDALGADATMTAIPMHHEQAVAIAADSFGRVHNTVGIAMVTSGPGGTNAITGVAGAWMESTPLLIISGQVSRATWKWSSKVRQMGFQEIDIVPIVKPITKYAVTVLDPAEIRYHLEKAIFLATSGRPGPVWLDLPLDVQAAAIDDSRLRPFQSDEMRPFVETPRQTDEKISKLLMLLKNSKRPILLGGHGVWLSDAKDDFRRLADILRIPIQTSWNGIDLIEDSHPLFFGRPNSYGPRYPNFIIQNSDFLLSIGSRLGLQQIGFNHKLFAREAKKVVVDIDHEELVKPTVTADLAIQTDAKYFIGRLIRAIQKTSFSMPKAASWIAWCEERKKRYPVCSDDHNADDGYVDPYIFFDVLSDVLPSGAVIVPGSSGTGFTVSNQVFKIKNGQRFFTSKGLSAMGYGLPSAIGACFAHGKRSTTTIIGDGGFQLNIQELQTIIHHRLPIKIFIFNNQGYLSIRVTQSAYFSGRFVGSDMLSGVSFPDLRKIAKTYGMPYLRIRRSGNLRDKIRSVIKKRGPVICEVMLNPGKQPLPKLSSYKKLDGSMESRPIEDLFPHLPREELRSNMIISSWENHV